MCALVVFALIATARAAQPTTGPSATAATMSTGPSTRSVEHSPEAFAAEVAARAAAFEARLADIDARVAVERSPEVRDRLLIERLACLHELGSIRGDSLDALDRAADDVLRTRPSGELRTAAEYWRLRVELLRREPKSATQPIIAQLQRIEQFLDRHPGCAYCPTLIAEAIDMAVEARDHVTIERLVARLESDFPDHPLTASLSGVQRLNRSRNEVWAPVLADSEGQALDWRGLRGRPVLVLFWASWDPASSLLLERLSGWPAMRDASRVSLVAISLDTQRERAVDALRRAGLAAVLVWDVEPGEAHAGPRPVWRSPLANYWGVRSLPVALLLDASGRLRHVVRPLGEDGWHELVSVWRGVGGTAP